MSDDSVQSEMGSAESRTRFINVDLELVTSGDIDPLLAHWGTLVILRDSIERGARTIWIELEEEHNDADATLDDFLSLVESLPVTLRGLWDTCTDRCFNVGVQARVGSRPETFFVSSRIVERLSSATARLAWTVYAPD